MITIFFFSFLLPDVSGLSQKWQKLRRRCASFKAVSGPTSLDSDASYILTEPATTYSVVPRDRQQSAGSITPTIDQKQRQYSWRKSHSVEKYDYRDVNLNSSIPEKIDKRIPLPEDYWKIHEQDIKVWKIGCATPNRPSSVRSSSNDRDSADWESNVQKYENMSDRRSARIQYFTGTDGNGNRKNSLENDRKEIKFPGLKAFKSASMRLPGQKSSLQEVHQLLRNKFNRLNVGLRKKRTLSVQEVFPGPCNQPGCPSSPQFYVPSPTAGNKIYNNESSTGPSSLPFYISNGDSATQAPNNSNVNIDSFRANSSKSSDSKTFDEKKIVTRSQSYRIKPKCDETESKLESTSIQSTNRPNFVVGGRVSLREKSTNKPSTATKIGNAVKDKIRMRPRSHSPVKHPDGKTTGNEPKHKKNRESFGLFDRLNRIMSINHLPPPHSNNNNNNLSINNMNRTKSSNPTGKCIISRHATGDATIEAAASKNATAQSSTPVIQNKSSDFNQTKKQPQLPETIFVRDRKITKQVPFIFYTISIVFHLLFIPNVF